MKKITSVFLIIVMACICLTGCSDPVADAIEQFTSTDMAEVNKDYATFISDYAKLNQFTDASEAIDFCNNTLTKELDTILGKVNNITVDEEKVKPLKTKYLQGIESYKDAIAQFVTAFESNDESAVTKANETITAAGKIFEDYNSTLKALCDEYGMTYKNATE